MASNYSEFYVFLEDENGVKTPIASVNINIHDLDADSSLGTVATDSEGKVAAGSVAPGIGTRISFWYQADGLANSVIQITT